MNYLKSSVGFLVGASLVFALGLFVSVPEAQAYEKNILVNQNMTIGTTGEGVVVLQGLLQELGYMTIPTGIPMGYYGSLTRDGLAKYQASQNVAPAVGYFGPLTKVAMHKDFSPRGWLSLLGW